MREGGDKRACEEARGMRRAKVRPWESEIWGGGGVITLEDNLGEFVGL